MALSSLLECTLSLFQLARDNVVEDTCAQSRSRQYEQRKNQMEGVRFASSADAIVLQPLSSAPSVDLSTSSDPLGASENRSIYRNRMNPTANIDDAVSDYTSRI